MRNPMSVFWKWLRYVLFEERNDPHAPNRKRRKIVQSAHLIQAWVALIGILSVGFIPLYIWLITVPGFVVAYLVWCAVTGIANIVLSFYVHRLNERDYHKKPKSALDVFYECR